jgi:cholesterol transport system auxiliary component
MRSQLQLLCTIMVISSMLMLTSCSLLSPIKSENKSTYVLNTTPTLVLKRATRPVSLLVLTPETRPAYNTTQMAYSIRPYQVAYFSQNQWGETPSQMLQPLLMQTLQNTHRFHAVVAAPYMGRYDYALSTEILQLQQDFTVRPARVQFKIRVQLTKVSTNNVIGTKQFIVNEPIRQKTPYSGVLAANRATGKILQEIAYFCVEKID